MAAKRFHSTIKIWCRVKQVSMQIISVYLLNVLLHYFQKRFEFRFSNPIFYCVTVLLTDTACIFMLCSCWSLDLSHYQVIYLSACFVYVNWFSFFKVRSFIIILLSYLQFGSMFVRIEHRMKTSIQYNSSILRLPTPRLHNYYLQLQLNDKWRMMMYKKLLAHTCLN